ncbi:MAG: hypothetical protein FWC87_05415 [Acidimicrobiaceae bacterium]|nr:hypothetical protein [Acidimicrobiaceae bacterium]
MVDLPTQQAELAGRGLDSWREGRLDEAQGYLERLRQLAASDHELSGMFHALHLLACVAFSRGDLVNSRKLHQEVLDMSGDLGFLGGSGSSLFDLGVIDRLEGDPISARRRFEAAREAYAAGGYDDRLAVVDRALEGLD